ncbi:hypothetical protein C8A01DRAFT_49720 [Parachaetomium inaequale]|uniref:CENP-V/GFA domain-containing protein n=1 Tax=Parachaetomium inaequale TaxID=2588326 RepID=A0AAN6PAF2_9PEZI|nr:hypothetical protein C8A01DRAFT_49720 [Parachaetomium inaequale]
MAIYSTLFRPINGPSLRITRKRVDTSRWNGPGKILLFPCQTSHSRIFPKRHSFSYSYLLVGIPVGFKGTAGGMVSVGAKGKPGRSSWLSLALFGSWFTVDAGDYLERGKAELGLRGKLDEYLQTQGTNPATYPYAYLVTAARFLGYHFNPVSFWYLYDADQRLAAMILEVNNTFDERRMYFLTADDAAASPRQRRRITTFKQSWPKDFHVSPFNSRKGSYTLTATDPLSTGSPISATITLLSSKNHPKLVADLSPAGIPLNPSTLTTYQKLRFLAAWWHVGFLTYPRILLQAFVLFFCRGLRVWFRPEPLRGTVCRRATAMEEELEGVFAGYVRHLVGQISSPLVVRYTPAGVVDGNEQVFRSATAAGVGGGGREAGLRVVVEELEVRVLTPVFYSRFVRYTDGVEGLRCECEEGGTVVVSRPELLARLTPKEKPGDLPKSIGFKERVFSRVVQYLRRGKGLGMSGMDGYVLGHESERGREGYRRCVVRVLMAERLAFGSVALLDGGWFLVRAVTYTADVDAPLVTGYDHCDDCQRQSGSTYSLVCVVPKDSLTIKGPIKRWEGTGSSGQSVWRLFCGECGSPIAHDPDAAPSIIALKGGSLDAEIKKTLKPDTEIWTVGKLPFCQENLEKAFTHMPQ